MRGPAEKPPPGTRPRADAYARTFTPERQAPLGSPGANFRGQSEGAVNLQYVCRLVYSIPLIGDSHPVQ